MSTKLRDLIRNIRACKTAAEERGLIQNEKALIRESFLKNEPEYRPRNVAKLLFIQMLGHDTDFGQMECLNLITANTYAEKRIGYLSLTQLFNEKSEVLMMATNRIRMDLNNQSNYIVSLALMAMSEVCTTEMCRELAADVLKLLQNGTAYIKKKAALASTRVVTRVPEKIDDFAQKVELLLEDRHHGVLVASLQLAQHIIKMQPDIKVRFVRFVAPMVRIFKSIYSTYSAEYDIGGVSDPFLQIEILKFFRLMCANNQQLSEEVSDILTQVAANTNNTKNTGNAVLYECVKTIFAIESANPLKTLGINILGKFLANKDANSKYISLFMLQKVLKHDLQAVQKYKTTILECLKENDLSIRSMALDLLYMITNESNVKTVVKELLNHLLNLGDGDDLTKELTNKICQIIEKYAPSRRWYIDTFIKVLILAGNFVSEESTSSLIHLVIGTPELQSYTVHKLYFSLQENLNQEALARTTAYCIGDFGQMLVNGEATTSDSKPINISEQEVVMLLTKLLQKQNQTDSIKEYTLSALIKLYSKLKSEQSAIKKLIASQTGASSLEVAKRASEYLGLLQDQWSSHRLGICEQIPPCPNFKVIYENKPIGDVELDEYPPQSSEQSSQQNIQSTTKQTGNLFEFDIDISTPAPIGTSQYVPQTINDDPFNLLNTHHTQQITHSLSQPQQQQIQEQQQQQQQQYVQDNDPFNLLNLMGNNSIPQQQQQQQPINTSSNDVYNIMGFDDNAIEITFSSVKEASDRCQVTASFANKTASPVTDLQLQVAVLKYLKLQMTAPTSNTIPGNSRGQVQQILKITNSQQGIKGIVMKLKIMYTLNGLQITKEQTCKFPIEY